MKVRIDDYEIEVRARMIYKEKGSQDDTLYFLNHLALVHDYAAIAWHKEGCHALAESCEGDSHNISVLLNKKKFYDDHKGGKDD